MRMLLTLPLAALAFAGCGSDDSSDTSGGSGSAAPPTTTAEPAAGGSAETGPQEVRIADFKFLPAKLTVAAGTKITWTNEDSAPHNAIGEGLKTKDLTEAGQSDTVTLTKPGTYDYICTFHAFMKGSVTVQ